MMRLPVSLLSGHYYNSVVVSAICRGGKLLSTRNGQRQARMITTTSLSQQDDKSDKRATVDDEIHEAISKTSVRFQEDRKPWVGFNPFKAAVPADWVSFLSQKIDWDTFVEDKIESNKLNKLRAMQEYSAERKKLLGGELAAARFVMAMNGKVKLFEDHHIYSRETVGEKDLPEERTPGLAVEAVDLSNTQIIYEGIQNLFQMQSVLHLSLSNCPRLDEWSVSRLAMMSSLVSLDLSHNPSITERSLIPLQHLPNLQRLNLRGIKYFTDVPLPLIFLEEHLPKCVITTDNDLQS